MKRRITQLAALVALSFSAFAAPQSFDFKDPKGVNNATFHLDAPLESITGSANGITGTVAFDPQNPASTRGKIVVAAGSLHVGNPMMKDHMHGEQWVDAKNHPEITFELKELKNVKTDKNVTTGDAVGTFTLKGVKKEMTVPVKLTYLADKLSARNMNQKGDLLVIRANFKILRKDFKINAGQGEDKVSDTIDLNLSIAGASPK